MKTICDYCRLGTEDKSCYVGGMEECQGELFSPKTIKFPKEMKKEELIESYEYNLTVGGLKEFLNRLDIPDESKVLIQRIEDMYYENNGWDVYVKEDEFGISQYTPAWSCVSYKDDSDLLFINLHY